MQPVSQACSKPEILAAVMECSQDSSKLAEYEHQPEVKRVCGFAFVLSALHHHTGGAPHVKPQ